MLTNDQLTTCSVADLLTNFAIGQAVRYGENRSALVAIEREDGSGNSYNLTLANGDKLYWRHTNGLTNRLALL